ncbi:MAG: dihydrodipicolinate synthase family protein [Pirellulales bacterium]|nr:dihydrodipicolinate synthase family protein [Pirellulales bacterium]
MRSSAYALLRQGGFIPAVPLALNSHRRFDESRQRSLLSYYIASGVDGLAVGVHTTQFEIRDPGHGLYRPVLSLAAEVMRDADRDRPIPLIRIAGVCGGTRQAIEEASLACELGYHAGLLSLAALSGASEDELVRHCQAVAEVIPIVGFYMQRAVGGVRLPYSFWRRLAEIENLVAVKIAPFNRYDTIDVVRAIVDGGRDDVALYTGNDDHILLDLLTPFRWNAADGQAACRRIVGGLLGHWAVWTHTAVELFRRCRELADRDAPIPSDLLATAHAVTDCNAAFFDVANDFRGCIAGIHEVLRRQGLLEGTWCLDHDSSLSRGQAEEIDRVYRLYPHLHDDCFVSSNRHLWNC